MKYVIKDRKAESISKLLALKLLNKCINEAGSEEFITYLEKKIMSRLAILARYKKVMGFHHLSFIGIKWHGERHIAIWENSKLASIIRLLEVTSSLYPTMGASIPCVLAILKANRAIKNILITCQRKSDIPFWGGSPLKFVPRLSSSTLPLIWHARFKLKSYLYRSLELEPFCQLSKFHWKHE